LGVHVGLHIRVRTDRCIGYVSVTALLLALSSE
jgi:hypothetical protein